MIITMSRYWRRRLAERLDLPPTASWYQVEQMITAVRGGAATDRRDRREMALFLTQAAGYWYAAGAAGEPPPTAIEDPP